LLKALDRGVLWLTRVYQVAWCSGGAPTDCQTGVIIPIHKQGESECNVYRSISLSMPGEVFANCLEKTCSKIIEPEMNDTQCSFRPSRGTTDQIFTAQQFFLFIAYVQ